MKAEGKIARLHRYALAAHAALVMLLVSGAVSAAPLDPLWAKAVETSRRNKAWVPGSAVFRVELLDIQGVRQDVWETKVVLSPGADGQPAPEVESASHNGKDVTAQEKENQARRNEDARRKGRPAYTVTEDPFDPDLQRGATVVATGEKGIVYGRRCVMYAFKVTRKEGGLMEGTAALDESTGAPVEATYTVTPLPLWIQKLTTILRYVPGPGGDGFLREVSVDGSGGLLLKRIFRSTILMDAYWSKSPA